MGNILFQILYLPRYPVVGLDYSTTISVWIPAELDVAVLNVPGFTRIQSNRRDIPIGINAFEMALFKVSNPGTPLLDNNLNLDARFFEPCTGNPRFHPSSF